MELQLIDIKFAVCKIVNVQDVDFNDTYVFIGKTEDELSLVCRETKVPASCIVSETGWRGFRVVGELDFSLVGILAKISGILAENKISIFAISTYNTDYILVKEEKLEEALGALSEHGYVLSEN